VVERLARPEQDECGVDRCLVATAGCVAHAREQPAAPLVVPDVRRRYGTVVHERVPERDVPRLERMNLAVEVLAAALESQVAVHHPSERSERLRCPADTRRAAYERTDALYVHLGRRALGEVLAKGVVELVDGCVRRPPGA